MERYTQLLRKYNIISVNNLSEETDAQLKELMPEKIPLAILSSVLTKEAMTMPYHP
jgi:hypothetical protein